MIKFLRKISKLLYIIAPFVLGSPVFAANYGLSTANSVANLPRGKGSTASQSIAIGVGNILGAVLAFLGILFLGLMIYGGILWMTTGGNEKTASKAKNIITAAVVGLIIVLSAYAITAYLGKVIVK